MGGPDDLDLLRLLIGFVVDFLNPKDLIGLRSLSALYDVELDLVTFFKALVTFTLDGAVVHEYVGTAFTAEESIALCVVEPLYGASILCQWSDSLASCLSRPLP